MVAIALLANKGGVGKTTTAVHIAGYLAELGTGAVLAVDGDPNRSLVGWARRADAGGCELPFETCDLLAAPAKSSQAAHLVIDTAARPDRDSIESMAKSSDLLILPSTPDALALEALLSTIDTLTTLGADNWRVLLTRVPTGSRKTGERARAALKDYPLLQGRVRAFAAFEKAALAGCLVRDVKRDRNAKIAWADYRSVGDELLTLLPVGDK